MKTKLLFATLLVASFGFAQTNLILNGTGDLFTVTSDDVLANPTWTRNDTDNADAWDMSPPSTVIYDADAMSGGATTSSPYRALWNNSDLDSWLGTNCGDGSEQPGSTSDGNFVGGVATRGVKLNEACRRLYQKVAVTSGVSYTLFIQSRSEAMNVPSEVYILNTEILDETGIDANGAADTAVDAYMEITNDFNSSKSNATTDNFTANSLEFTPSGSFVVIYVRAPLAINSSNEVFYDNIELYETSTLSTNDVFASNLKIYPNPAKTSLTVQSSREINSVELYNIVGLRVFASKELVNDAIDVSEMASGVYLLKVNADNASVTKRVVIE